MLTTQGTEPDPHADHVPAAELREIGLFGALSDEVLAELSASLPVLAVSAGQVLFRESDPARELYVIADGEVEIVKHSSRGHDVRVAMLGPHDCFGEMSMLDVQPRSAMARTLAPSRLIVFGARDLDALYRRDVKSYAIIVLNLAREMARRLRVADRLIAEFMLHTTDSYVDRRRGTPR